ncbi:hypothetical protein [Pararhodobacter sp. SW119]|uniref:hypothetical protein n=1 Tax=Pararhodobacter sp. SW119 TaxID=2780075 RepID=UPI001AE0D724|nr:hypothetical protein [Pararhodobacter sp. SW119]
MRLISAAVAGMVLSLAACIDVDMETAVLGADQARVTGHMQVQRQMYEMMGSSGDFCSAEDGGVIELTDTHARCVVQQTGTFAEIFESGNGEGPTPEAIDLGDGTVRVVFPLGEMSGELDEVAQDPNMIAMFRPMMEGHSIVLRISGAEIVSSNGIVSSDRTSAMMKFALTELIDQPDAIPATFEAVVRY